MKSAYAAAYRDLYRRHWWWRARERFLVARLTELAPTSGFGDILDVGCGDALLFPVLSRFGDTRGVEPDAATIDPENPLRDRIYAGPLETYAADRTFGLIVALDVIEHVDDPDAFARRLASMLAPGGRLVLTVPAGPSLWTEHDVVNEHRRRYRAGELPATLRRAGLEVTDERFFFVWMIAAKLAVRALESVRRPRTALPRVPAAPVNAALFALCRAEQQLIGGAHPPGGSSLYVAARAAR